MLEQHGCLSNMDAWVILMIVLLLVDDDEMSRNLIGSGLARMGYVVLMAANGREGVELASGESPHAILMDLRMPEMDGFEATKRLKSHGQTSRIPIVAITALNRDGDVRRAYQAGCDSYEMKPVNMARLNLKIRNLGLRARPEEWADVLE